MLEIQLNAVRIFCLTNDMIINEVLFVCNERQYPAVAMSFILHRHFPCLIASLHEMQYAYSMLLCLTAQMRTLCPDNSAPRDTC